MENCPNACSPCRKLCGVDCLLDIQKRNEELERICEQLETELADANSFIKMVDSETEEGMYDDDYE